MVVYSDTQADNNAVAEKFKDLLRELFQFSRSDWDFGIYRIMNLKREELLCFIDKKIVAEVDSVLQETAKDKMTDSDVDTVTQFVKKQITTFLEEDSFENGKLKPAFRDTPLGAVWLAMEKVVGQPPPSTDTLRIEVFNRLYDFFSRYYDEGDFICKPRYAAKNRYAVPYNGEEVILHWANKDQYYIKTAERFACYAFNLKGKKIRFVLRDAQVEADNNKAEDKYYIPIAADFVSADKGDATFMLPFEYRALTADEARQLEVYNQKQDDKNGNGQEGIIAWAMQQLPKEAMPFLTDDGGGEERALEWQIKQYIKRNNADFFIHKNLRAFLGQELTYYINSELLIAEEMAQGNSNSEARYRVADAIYRVASTTIDFLGQLEDFQKAIWEKKKFITATHYCVTLCHLPDKSLLADIASCPAQWDEWVALNFCSVQDAKASKAKKLNFLSEHPTLVVDTANFTAEFREKLLASYDNLEEATDGVLFNCENWQALNLMQEKYKGKVDCIHIDPPYNTETSGFLYKNNFRHSSWMAMMENRINLSMPLLSLCSVFQCHIDENESNNLIHLLSHLTDNQVENIIWDKTHPLGGSGKIATQHENIVVIRNGEKKLIKKRELAEKVIKKGKELAKKNPTDIKQANEQFSTWLKSQQFNDGEDVFYHLDKNGPYQTVHMGAPEQRTDKKFFCPLYHPVTNKPCPVPSSGWSNTPEFMAELLKNDEISFGEDETIQPRRKVYLADSIYTELSTIIINGSKGKSDLSKLGLSFPYCHPNSLYEKLILSCSIEGILDSSYTVDYFAGSGTTAHAVINLNREYGDRRKFILAEMGKYFKTVLLPRIKKVIFTPEWKAGKPVRQATADEATNATRLIKYHRIESYDDALENIAFDTPESGLLSAFTHYQSRYMLKMESRESATFATPNGLNNPFNYTLKLAKGGDKTVTADLPETFIYLSGMSEKTRKTYYNGKQKYVVQRGELNGKETVAIWRDVTKWKAADYDKERTFITKQKITDGAQVIYFNNDSAVENAQSLTPLLTKRMFGADSDF